MAERGEAIASADDIDREITALKDRLTALDRERSKIADRLGVLERRADQGTSKPAATPARRARDDGLTNRREDRALPEPVPRAGGGISAPMGESEKRKVGLFACVSE